MHNAPAVTYPVGRPRSGALLATALVAIGAGVTVLWTLQADAPGWRQLAAAGSVLVAGLASLAGWLRSIRGNIHWDGAGWTLPDSAERGRVVVTLDLQRLLLVHWRSPAASHWLWLERHRSPERWLDLRRAVYSRARPQALPPDRPPAATP